MVESNSLSCYGQVTYRETTVHTESKPLQLPVFRAILASMGEGIIFADADDRIRYINAAAEEIRGIIAANYLGRSIVSIHSPASEKRIRRLIAGLKGGAIPFSTRVIHVREKIFENSYYPIRNETGTYEGTLLISRDITEKEHLKEENISLREQVRADFSCGGMIGKSHAMEPVFHMIRATAALDSTILISGESGTGKELVACAIHQMSPRHKNSFVKVNCAALPETLLESELFGHERGAFTGAVRERKGKFEQAHRGTIFLDEIGEMPLAAQAKLLRVIQGKTLERIGGNREIAVDVRIIAATNKDLRREVERGTFREDLFYRLNVIPVHLPPLRERREDILPLAEHFLAVYAERMCKPVRAIDPEARKALLNYDYPGNVRELENALERGVALSLGETVTLADLAPYFMTGAPAAPTRPAPAATLSRAVSDAEQEAIREALRATGNRKGVAAQLLGISRKTLWEKLKQMDPM